MTTAPRCSAAVKTLALSAFLAALLVPAAGADPSVARRLAAPRPSDARLLPSLAAGGGPALPSSPIVSPTDTFLVAGFGFQDLTGACKSRGWTAEDRVPAVYAHPAVNFVINESFFIGQAGGSQSENLTGLIATTALRNPRAVAVDDSGHVFLSDEGFLRTRLFKAYPQEGIVTEFGSYPTGGIASIPNAAAFDPLFRTVVASDPGRGTLLRFLGGGATAQVIAGGGPLTQDTTVDLANIGQPAEVALAPNGDVYFADPATHRVRKLTNGRIVTIAGTGTAGSGGLGPPLTVALNSPSGVALDPVANKLYISDTGNNLVRTLDLGLNLFTVSTPVTSAGSAAVQPSVGALFVAGGNQIFEISTQTYVVTRVTGGDGYGPPSSASLGLQQALFTPAGLTSDGFGGLYFADTGLNLVFHLLGNDQITSAAGVPVSMTMGLQSLWFGLDAATDPEEVSHWVQPLGYGNSWSQRLTSPQFSLVAHPGAIVSFDAAVDLGFGESVHQTIGGHFVGVQGLKADGSWAFLSARLTEAAAPPFPIQAFAGRGVVHVTAALNQDGNDLLGLAGATRIRIVMQTNDAGSNEDGLAPNTRGALVVDNLSVDDPLGTVIPRVDFENGTTGAWQLSALNGTAEVLSSPGPGLAARPQALASVDPFAPYTRDVPLPGTQAQLLTSFDPQDPTCAWTFLANLADSVASGTFARLTSPWFVMAPGDTQLLISFSGKLNTLDEGRFVHVLVRGKKAGDVHPRFLSPALSLLTSGTSGGDPASPYLNQMTLNYPADFLRPLAADSLQVVFQVEDRGESTDPIFSLDNRPRTRLPYLDDVRFYQMNVDRDHDGVADAFDACPDVCAAGQDGDGDGCPDPTATLHHVESWARAALPLHYTISQAGDPANPTGNDLTETAAGFNVWTTVPDCSLTVVRDPDTAQTNANGLDGVNLVTFQDPDFQFPAGVLAVTPTLSFTRRTVFDDRVVLPGQIVDADMIFNPASHFSTPGFTPPNVTSYDLRSVTTHEAGHFYGLSHSGVLRASMFFVIQPGQGAASLEADDRAAIAAAYPGPQFGDDFGTIVGRVTRGATGDSLPGALVTAVLLNVAGAPVDSMASDYTDEHGNYALRGIPAGSYGVRLTPLDGEVGGFPLTPDYISERVAKDAQTNFAAEWYGGPESATDDPNVIAPVAVGAGATRSEINILSNIDTTPPFVTASNPADQATQVRTDATILVSFSERIDPGTLNGAFRLHLDGSNSTLGGSALLINGARTLIFNPTVPLLLNQAYVLDITSGIKDREGVPLAPPTSVHFHTLTNTVLAISDVEPRAAARGSFITVLGGGFDAAAGDSVLFSGAGTPVPATSVTPTLMVVRVPFSAVTGPLRAIVHQGASNLSPTLTVLAGAPQVAPSRVTDIALNFAPTDVSLSPDGAWAYAVGAGGLATINLSTRVPAYWPVGASSHLALTPDGHRALLTQPALGRVLDVDADPASLTFGAIKATIPVGSPGTPDGVAVSPSGRRAFVTDQIAPTIYAIDTDPASATRDSVVDELADPTVVLTGGVTVLPTDNVVLYTSGNEGSRANNLTSHAVSVFHVGASGGGVAATPSAGEALYAGTGAFGEELLAVSLSNGNPVSTSQITLGGSVRDVTVAPQGQSALVVNSGTSMLQVIGVDSEDAASYHMVAAEVGTGATPVAVSQSADGGVIAVANFGSRTIGIYRAGGGAGLVRSLPEVARPGDRVAAQSGGTLFGIGSQVDLGDGPFAISYRTPDSRGAAFVVPPGTQREASLSGVDPTGTRTLTLPFRVVDPIGSPAPHLTGFSLNLVPITCSSDSVGFFDAMRLSPDGSLLALVRNPGACAGPLELFAARDNPPKQFGQPLSLGDVVFTEGKINDVAFTTDGRRLWAVDDNSGIRVMDTDRSSRSFGTQINSIGFPTAIAPRGIAADPLGRYMCVGSSVDDTIRIFDPAGALLSRITSPGTSDAAAVSPDGRFLVVSGGGRVRFVNLETLTAIGTSPLHGSTQISALWHGVAIPSNGRRAVVRFSDGIGVYNLDPAAGAVGSELYFGNPLPPAAASASLSQLIPGPGGSDVLAGCANCDSLVDLDASVVPPVVSFAPLPEHSQVIAAPPDGRQLWVGHSSGTSGLVRLMSMSPATTLALVSGAPPTGLPGTTLPVPVTVHTTDGSGRPQTGVAVRFILLSGEGSLDNDSTSAVHFTDANGEASVHWTLPTTLGFEPLLIQALGVPGSLNVITKVVPDNSQIFPAVLAFGPPNGTQNLNVGTSVFINFNQSMDPATTTARMKLFANGGPVAGAYHFEQNGAFVVFQPTQPLPFAARCSLTVVPGALDTDGQALATGGFSVFSVQTAPPGPTVTSISPPAAGHGAPVVLSGSGFSSFGNSNTVLFNAVPTAVTAAAPTSLTSPVPPGSTSGLVTVQVGSAVSPGVNFTVLRPAAPITTASDSIPAGPTATKVVITSDGARAYVTNPSSNTVTAIDLATLATLAVIPVGLRPSGIDLLPDDSRLYVCNQNSDNVSVIDTHPGSASYNQVVATVPVGHQPRDLAVSAFGPVVIVVNYGSNNLSVIDGNTGNATFDQVTTTINTGSGGTAIGITPDGGRAYICTSSGTVVRFDLMSGAVTTTINTGSGGTAIGITPDGTMALVLLENGQLVGINIVPGSNKENQVTTTINTGSSGGGGGGVAISPDGGTAYVTNADGNIVFVYSIVSSSGPPVSFTPGPAIQFVKVDSIPVGRAPLGVAIDPQLGRFGLVANSGSGTLTVIGVLGIGPPVQVTFDFNPNTLNLKSMGNWVSASIGPPAPFLASDIDVASLRLNGVVPVDPTAPVSISGNQLKVKFSRNRVELVVSTGDAVPVTVTGMMANHRLIGTDIIRVKRGSILAPAAGNLLQGGHPYTLRWTTPNGVTAQWVAVLHSFDRGLNWTLDATRLPNIGDYRWWVPWQTGDSVKVAVALVESGDTTGVNVSAVLGVSDYFKIVGTTDVEPAPAELSFAPLRPNPAGDRVALRFGLPRAADVKLEIYDLQGRRVRTLLRGLQPAGWHELSWSGQVDGGAAGAGVYFVRFQAEGREFRQRLVWLR